LKERERDDRDDEIARLKSKVGEIIMDNELLNAKIAALRPSSFVMCQSIRMMSGCLAFAVS
jgi:hypothetical protein